MMVLVISQSALAVLVLFSGQFDSSIASVDNFLEASVEMYVFMATGENYIELVNQVRKKSSRRILTTSCRHGEFMDCMQFSSLSSALWG